MHEAVAILVPGPAGALRIVVALDSALAWPKLASAVGVVAISPPPAMMTSASPYWMVRMPRPIACVEVVQAVTTPRFGPLAGRT